MKHLNCRFCFGRMRKYLASRNRLHQHPIFFSIRRFPFDWKNPVGYFFAVTLQYISVVYFFIFTECVIFFGVGCFVFELSATNDLKNDLAAINNSARKKKNKFQALSLVSDFIQSYSNLKQLG